MTADVTTDVTIDVTAVAIAQILSGDIKPLEQGLNRHPQADQLKRLLARGLCTKLFFPTKDLCSLDNRLKPALDRLQNQFEEFCAQDLNFFTQSTHPLRQVFETLLKLGSTWYARDTKASQIFFDQISELIDASIDWMRAYKAGVDEKPRSTQLLKALTDFIRWANSDAKRAELLEERLCETELSQLNLIAAENYAIEAINDAFTQVRLPTDLSMRLNTHLKNCLQHAYLQEAKESATSKKTQENFTKESAFLRKWQQLFPLLRKIFIAHQEGEDTQSLYRDVPIAINELELSIPLAAGAQDTYTEFVSMLNHRLMQIIQQQPIECFAFAPLVGPQEISLSQPSSLLQKNIAALKTGQWFLVCSAQGDWVRCKLALINEAAHYLLFVDNSGRKVMLKSFAEFSTLLAAGDARAMPEFSIEKTIHDCITQLFKKLASDDQANQQSNQIKNQASQTNNQAREQNNSSPEQQKIARERIAKEKQAAAQKAQAEAAALAALNVSSPIEVLNQFKNILPIDDTNSVEKISTETPEKTEAPIIKEPIIEKPVIEKPNKEIKTLDNSELPSLEICAQQINTLSLGAWVELPNAVGEIQRLKLAVIIAAAGKYIFVDELGRKQGDYLREQLIEIMHQGQLRIISQGEKFEDQLVKVIRGLRKDIS